MMKTYLINLERSHDRLTASMEKLQQISMAFERVTAVDGNEIKDENFIQTVTTQSFRKFGRSLSRGEIGCYLSHLDCIQKFLATDEAFCLVLEDDFKIALTKPADFPSVLDEICQQWVGTRFNLVNLSNTRKRLHSPVVKSSVDPTLTLCAAHSFPFLTTGLLWSRSGAERFLAECARPIRPVDVELQCWIAGAGGGMAFDHPPVCADGSESLIEPASTSRHENKGKTSN